MPSSFSVHTCWHVETKVNEDRDEAQNAKEEGGRQKLAERRALLVRLDRQVLAHERAETHDESDDEQMTRFEIQKVASACGCAARGADLGFCS